MLHSLKNEKVSRGVEWVLAVVLMVAAGLKLYEMGTSSMPMAGVVQNRMLLTAAVEGEWLLALWLMVGGAAWWRRVMTVWVFGSFCTVALYEMAHRMPSCGCFGAVSVPPWVTAIFDMGAVVALLVTWGKFEEERRWRGIAWVWVVGVVVATGLPWGVYVARADVAAAEAVAVEGGTIVVEPEGWEGKAFPLFAEVVGADGKVGSAGDVLKEGQWLVVMYHHDCHTCQRAVPSYMEMAKTLMKNEEAVGKVVHHVAFLEIPPVGTEDEELVAASKEYVVLGLRSDREWFVSTPLVVALKEGRVVWTASGEKAAEPPPVSVW